MARLLACVLLLALIPSAVSQNLAGHRLVVRRYNKLDTNPAAYAAFFVDIKADGLALEAGRIGDMGALVLTAPDQQDPDVAALLQGGVFSVAYRDGQIDTGAGFQALAQHRLTLDDFGAKGDTFVQRKVVLDALGKPIAGAAVEMKLAHVQNGNGPVLALMPSDPEGAIEYPSPRGFYLTPRIAIKHDRYGISLVSDYAESLPLVPGDSPAAERALSGRVVDGSGKPVAGVVVAVDGMHGLTAGSIQVMPGCAVLTDANGRFRVYPSRKDKRAEDPELIPPGVTFNVSLSNPADRSQPVVQLDRLSSNCGDLVLANNTGLRRFTFQNADGTPFDAERIRNVAISGPGAKWAYGLKEAAEGRRFIAGKYEAELPADRVKFEPVTIDENSPEVLVFRISQPICYEGRVIDATTSRPLNGALVYAIVARVDEPWQGLTRAQWDAIHRLPREPKMDDPALAPARRIALVRTDNDGRYRLPAPVGANIHSLGAVEQNFLDVHRPVHARKPDAKGVIAVDDFVLAPSGGVSFTIVAPKNESLQVTPMWELNRTSLDPKHQAVFFSPEVGNRVIFPINNWIRTGTSVTLAVPANISFGLLFRPDTRHTHVAPLRVAGPMRLAPGERIDLGVLAMTNSVLATVQVIGPDDAPIEGVPVRNCYEMNGQKIAFLPCTTDAQGLAFLDVGPGMNGTFMVALGRSAEGGFKIEIPYDCPVGAAEMPLQTIKLTEEQLAIVKKTLGNKPNPSRQR